MPYPDKEPHISPFDRFIKANGASFGSLLLNCIPHERNRFVTSDIPIRWRNPNFPTGRTQAHAYFEGHEGASKLPARFEKIGIVLIDRVTMDEHLRTRVGKQAVSYALGTVTMIGESPTGRDILGLEHEDAEDYKVAMGIGDGPLIAGVGTYVRHHKLYIPLERGVRAGEVMLAGEKPAYIPRV